MADKSLVLNTKYFPSLQDNFESEKPREASTPIIVLKESFGNELSNQSL